MNTPLVSCVTVTYGRTPSLRPMLESLERTIRRERAEIIVVTQPDAEGRTERGIRSVHPLVNEVNLDENIGFGLANNLAVSRSSGHLVALLNPDLVLTEGWLDPLASALDDPTVTIAAPPLLTPTGELDEAGQIMYADGGSEPFGREGFAAPYERLMFSRDVDYSSAACWLMRRGDFERLQGFSPDYAPAYFEDADLAFRVWKSGGRCRLVTNRPVIHDHAAPSAARREIAVRSRAVFQIRWADELSRQPTRSGGREDCERVRDHRCAETRRVDVTRRTTRAEAESIVAEAGRWAESNPTSRMIVMTNRRPEVERWRRSWCARGLEIVTAPS